MISQQVYKIYLNHILQQPCSAEKLHQLKQIFSEEINSKRTFDSITSMLLLILTLEKRNELSPVNITPLKTIANCLGTSEDIFSPKELPNPVIPIVSKKCLDRVYDIICSDLGSNWIYFARALQIKEGHIDDLQRKYSRTRDRVWEVLEFYKDNCDKRKFKSGLLDALRKARRNDLCKEVQNIFDTCLD